MSDEIVVELEPVPVVVTTPPPGPGIVVVSVNEFGALRVSIAGPTQAQPC